MKNKHKEVKLVYRKLNDPFFVINKPVNWTLKEKNGTQESNTKIFDYSKKCMKTENETYKNVLKKLSVVEKNAFLFTNSTSLCYNNFCFSLNQENWKRINSDKSNQQNRILKKNGINKFIETYYVKSLLRNETNRTLFYPYKLPAYMSGLVICCSDYFLYKTFLQQIEENKAIIKYRCLINNPWVSSNKCTNFFTTISDNIKYGDPLRSNKKIKKNFEILENINFENKKTQERTFKKEDVSEEIENKVYIKQKKGYIKGLTAQKKANDLFPFHNFYNINSVSKNYWNCITDLELRKWKNKMMLLTKKTDHEKRINLPLGKKKRRLQFSLNIDEEKRKKQPFENSHFVQIFLKRSEPVKSLNTVFTHIFNNGSCNEYISWKEKSSIENCDKKDNKKKLELPLSYLYNFDFHKMWSGQKKKITFPLSLFLNEGNFYHVTEKRQIHSYTYSMIYKIYNYKEYLQQENIWKKERHDAKENVFENMFLIDFFLLDRIKPDVIRFFFSEMKTPIVNDNIFDKTNFKKDIINQAMLENEKNVVDANSTHSANSPNDIFRNAHTQEYESSVPNNIHNDNYDKAYANYMFNAFKPSTSAFSIVGCDDKVNGIQQQQKIQINNFFVHGSGQPKEVIDPYKTDQVIKTNNLCLELYQLQFCDPISNDYVKIENSLPNDWL